MSIRAASHVKATCDMSTRSAIQASKYSGLIFISYLFRAVVL